MDNRFYIGLLPTHVQLKGEEKVSPFTKLKKLVDLCAKCQNLPQSGLELQTGDSPSLKHITQYIIEWSQDEGEIAKQVTMKNINFFIDLLDLLDKAKGSVDSDALKDQAFNDALFMILKKFLTLHFRAFEKNLKILLALSYDRLIRWNIEQNNNSEYFLEKKGKIFSSI